RLTRPRHWLDFKPFTMAHSPLGLSAEQAEAEVRQAWKMSYSPRVTARALKHLKDKPIADRIIHLLSRLAFRGIYFPQLKRRDWVRVLFDNRGPIFQTVASGLAMKFKPRPRPDSGQPESD
ncbi:MAG TPA: hypothetical protein VIX19_16330, partial [Terriglobales bacterium]